MAPNRYSGGQDSSTALEDRPESSGRPTPSGRAGWRAQPTALRGRMVMAAVAIGAVAAASAGQSLLPKLPDHESTPVAEPGGTVAVLGPASDNQEALEVQPMARTVDQSDVAAQLAASQQVTNGSGTNAQNVDDVTFAKPADGPVVSTFGGQYGTLHYGIEIQGKKDAPIYAAADGVIIAAGPTSGFGLWVKEKLSDGTTLVYARVNDYSVQVGQHVVAGTQIARMGDRGFSNGYTLHFEVWQPNGTKIDPVQWLSTRGVTA